MDSNNKFKTPKHDIMSDYFRREKYIKSLKLPITDAFEKGTGSKIKWLIENGENGEELRRLKEWKDYANNDSEIIVPKRYWEDITKTKIIDKYSLDESKPNFLILLQDSIESEEKRMETLFWKFVSREANFELLNTKGAMTYPTTYKEVWDIEPEHYFEKSYGKLKGFADLFIKREWCTPGQITIIKTPKLFKSIQELLKQNNGKCLTKDLWNVEIIDTSYVYWKNYLIEIKPEIWDCGELERQLGKYRNLSPNTQQVVFSLDTNNHWDENLEKMGVIVVHTTEDEMKEHGKTIGMEWE